MWSYNNNNNNNNNGFISHISIADTLNYNVFTIWFNY
jgi:hypothetical protein